MELEDQDLLPSLNSFHRYLCSLDYYTDFKDKLNTVNNSVETKDEEGAPVAAVGEKIKLKVRISLGLYQGVGGNVPYRSQGSNNPRRNHGKARY
jgi:hypothetical protein